MITKLKEEKLFPRGGAVKRKNPTQEGKSIKRYKDDDLFATNKRSEKNVAKKVKKIKKSTKNEAANDPFDVKTVSTTLLFFYVS